MNRIEIIDKIGTQHNIGNVESGEFSYPKALKSIGKNIKDYQKGTAGAQHQYLDLRFENERLSILVECKNKFSKWDKKKNTKKLFNIISSTGEVIAFFFNYLARIVISTTYFCIR